MITGQRIPKIDNASRSFRLRFIFGRFEKSSQPAGPGRGLFSKVANAAAARNFHWRGGAGKKMLENGKLFRIFQALRALSHDGYRRIRDRPPLDYLQRVIDTR